MLESKPTPTPWEVVREGMIHSREPERRRRYIAAASLTNPDWQANAALIAEAVNAHADLIRQRDTLLSACQQAHQYLADAQAGGVNCTHMVDALAAAIADCERETPNVSTD